MNEFLLSAHTSSSSKSNVPYVKFYYQFTTHYEKQRGCGVGGTWQCNNTNLSFEKAEKQKIETKEKVPCIEPLEPII